MKKRTQMVWSSAFRRSQNDSAIKEFQPAGADAQELAAATGGNSAEEAEHPYHDEPNFFKKSLASQPDFAIFCAPFRLKKGWADRGCRPITDSPPGQE